MDNTVNKTRPYLDAYNAIRCAETQCSSPSSSSILDHGALRIISLISHALGIPSDTVAQKLADYDEPRREFEQERNSEQIHKWLMSLTKADAYDDENPPD